MNVTEVALPESYPTFWNSVPSSPASLADDTATAYEAFVNQIEDELTDTVDPDAE